MPENEIPPAWRVDIYYFLFLISAFKMPATCAFVSGEFGEILPSVFFIIASSVSASIAPHAQLGISSSSAKTARQVSDFESRILLIITAASASVIDLVG